MQHEGDGFFIVFYTNFTYETPTKVLYLRDSTTEQECFLYHLEVQIRNELLTKFYTKQGLYQKGRGEDSV